MPNDFITLNALCAELDEKLAGARLDKICQPEKDELRLAIKTASARENLVISCNPQSARIHLTDEKKENPLTAPTFCMSARKHLGGGIIKSVTLPFDDRIADIEIAARNEMNDVASFHLIAELMGRYSNILLTDADFRVLDCVKRISYDTATKRCIMPAIKYEPPAIPRVNITNAAAVAELLEKNEDGSGRFFASNVSGISRETAEEILLRANYPAEGKSALEAEIGAFGNAKNREFYAPCVSIRDGIPKDYFICPYFSQDGAEWKSAETLNEAAALCSKRKDDAERTREKSKPLAAALKSFVNKNRKKLQKNMEKLAECEKSETLRETGELILNNVYAYKKGENYLDAVDYSKEECPVVRVELSGTPQETAQTLFKKYTKLKRAKEVAKAQAEECKQLLDYAESIAQSLETSETNEDYKDVETELASIGALRKNTVRDRRRKKSEPLKFDVDGFRLVVGKNNLQNDELTFKTAHGGDLWFHSLGYHGSHAVLFTDNKAISDETKIKAAQIAANYSKGREADKIPVDCTLIKFVKRHPSKALGMVVYTNQNTFYVKPESPESEKPLSSKS